MTPFRVPSTGGTQIGAMWIEQQRAESCRGHGAGKGGQLAAARGGGVAGAERSASQAGVGALSRWGCESAAAWQLRASLQPSSPRGVSPSGARSGRQALCGLRADAGGGTLGGRRRTASGRRDPAALEVKRHLVCKRWTIEKADENSNGIPWFVLHRPNSDKLRFHLPSLPWHWFDA